MKAFKFILSLLVSIFMFTSCLNIEEVGGPTVGEDNTVRFSLGGSAAKIRTTRTVSEENESQVNSILACVWNMEDNSEFYIIDAKPIGVGDEWDIKLPKDGSFAMTFIANANDETRKAIENAPKLEAGHHGTSAINIFLRKIVVNQECDGEEFLMTAANFYFVNTGLASGAKDLGTVNFRRRSARFDIINKAEGITINKITFNNRTVLSHVTSPSTWEMDDSGYEDKVYADLNIVGSSDEEKAGKLQHTIYSYRNHSTNDNGKLPSLTIEYTETDKDGSSDNRTHTVEFIDPDKANKSPLPIYNNRLYTITLTKAHKLNFELQVLDWQEGDEFNTSDLQVNDLDIPSDEQQRLNALLKVSRFADYHVKSLDMNKKEVEFFDKLSCDLNDYSTATNGSYFKITDLYANGLCDPESKNSYITDKVTGDKYRVPTGGEVILLFPFNAQALDPDNFNDKYIDVNGKEQVRQRRLVIGTTASNPDYTNRFNMAVEWDEPLNFVDTKRDNKFYYDLDKENKNNSCMHTKIQACADLGNPLSLYIKDYMLMPENMGNRTNFYSAYAVRFKGTSEYAAYKYEVKTLNGDVTKSYLSVKIKAIPENMNVSIYDVAYNESYWDKDCIEYDFPFIGRITNSNTLDRSASVLILSMSYSELNSSHVLVGGVAQTYIETGGWTNAYRYPLRLIKVEEDDEPTSED